MKRILSYTVIALLLVFIGILTYNMFNTNKLTLAEVQSFNVKNDIVFKVTSVSSKKLEYEIVNNSLADITYDTVYEIQKEIDGKWYKYGVNIDFVKNEEKIVKGTSVKGEIIFGNVYSLDKGTYRLLKVIDGNVIETKFEI